MTEAALAPQYDPTAIESSIYARWTEAGLFQPRDDPGATPYVIVIPPPNVTDILHMGHGLNNTVQDLLIRFERMRGALDESSFGRPLRLVSHDENRVLKGDVYALVDHPFGQVEGSLHDDKTLPAQLEKLRKRFKLGSVIVVSDRAARRGAESAPALA